MPADRIAALVGGESDESFDALARVAFARDYRESAAYRAFCDRRGTTPESLDGWRQVPAIPVGVDARPPPPAAAPEDGPRRRLCRLALDRCLAGAGLAPDERPATLSLVAPRALAPGEWPPVLADHVLERRPAPGSVVAFSRRGVEVAKARSFLAARQRDRRPTLILATGTSIEQLLEALERRGLRFRLPPGSRLVECLDGAARPSRAAPGERSHLARLAAELALAPEAVIDSIGWPGVVSRFFAGHDAEGGRQPFHVPAWARVRALAPRTLEEAAPGECGLLAVFDLASLGAGVHRITDCTGVAVGDGFALGERATEAELAACRRIAAELTAAAG